MSDPTSRIQIGSDLPKKARVLSYKKARFRSGWPRIVTAKRISSTSKPVCIRIIWPGFWQNATSPLPVSHFQTRQPSSTDGPDLILQNQSGSNLVLADCQVRAKRIRSGRKPACKNHRVRFWTTLLSRSGLGANWIRHY